jgi:fibronectin type 3 domain-containing protein
MKLHGFLTAGLALILVVGLAGCGGELTSPTRDNSADPENPNTGSEEPGKPSNLGAIIADRVVALNWSMSDTTDIEEYMVYRWEVIEDETEDLELLNTATTSYYADEEVRNGTEYAYAVSAVNTHGLEGLLSSTITATPAIYGVTIDNGQMKTPSRNVTLTMSAAAGTQLMQLSNNENLVGAQWQPFRTTSAWELEGGDGVKNVYARFRDGEDNDSTIASDGIILDTRAVIESVTEDTQGASMVAGETIHFTLDAQELYGQAEVDIGNVVIAIALYDDGVGGDTVPNDGVYERDYVIEIGVEILDGTVSGFFTDDVGNQAEPVVAQTLVTILDPPTSVTLNPPVPISERRIGLSWTRNNDSDFDSYRLYRSYIPGVDTSSERELIADITNQTLTDFTDTGLEPDSTYYYAVYVFDDIGLSAISNEVVGTTMENELPTPVELAEPWAPDSASLELSWSVNTDDDFLAYELFCWDQDPPNPPDLGTKRVIARLTDRTETFFTHESLVDSFVYWYEVAVVDSFGGTAVSNTVSGSPRPAAP